MFLFLTTLALTVNAQSAIDSIDTNRLYQSKKRKFIKNKYLQNIHSFTELRPSCINEKDSLNYNYQNERFLIKENIHTLWDCYKHLSLADIYSGHTVHFGFMYSKKENKIIYIDTKNYKGMNVGQVFFINLELLGGLKKLPVAYEVTDVDDENMRIKFCYIRNGVSEGSQTIILSQAENGYTQVQHNTVYRSNSKLRDKYLYPPFHRKVVKEFHKNLMISIKQPRKLLWSKS